MPSWGRQAATIPVRDGRVCLVTSSNGRRWVLPKGQIDPGHTPAEAALVEAWEEAGLVGALEPALPSSVPSWALITVSFRQLRNRPESLPSSNP